MSPTTMSTNQVPDIDDKELCSCKMVRGNFEIYKAKLELMLDVKGLLSILDGTESFDANAKQEDQDLWIRKIKL